jgi:hypothetical protein
MNSDPPPLRGAATVVRNRGDVGDRADLEAGGLQGADRGLAARARALDEHVDLAHAVLLGAARGVLGGHLRAYGVDLREPLKPTWPAEAHEITLPIGSVIETMVLLNVLLM